MVKLADIPVLFICPSHNEKYKAREERMWSFLKSCGFRNITHIVSGHQGYQSLTEAFHTLLSTRLDNTPFLLVEDDIALTECATLDMEITYPEDADAMYLGFSTRGGSLIYNHDDGPSQIQLVSNTHIKIHNMLSGHAILYISERYKRAVMTQMQHGLDTAQYYCDVLISRIQSKYNVYGYYYPFFYQLEPESNRLETNFRYPNMHLTRKTNNNF